MTTIDLVPALAAIISLTLLRRIGSTTNIFNPFVYFFWIYFLFCFVAIFYRDLYLYSINISNKTIFLLSLGIVFLSLGGSLANSSVKRGKTHKSIENLIGEAVGVVSTRSFLVYFLIFVSIAIALLFTVKVGKIFWFSDSFDDERIILRQGTGWISILGISSSYIAIIYASIHFYKKRAYGRLSLATLLLSACAVSYGNRAPGADVLVVGGVFVWVGIFGKISFYHFVIAFLSALALVMVLGVARQGLEFDLLSVYKQMLWRPFTNIQNLEWIIAFIPDRHDYFYGRSLFIDLAVLVPGYQPNFGIYIKELMGKDFTGGGITVSFLGQCYADFGFGISLGVIFLFGYFLQKTFLSLSGKGRWFPLLIIISISTKSMASSGIVSPLIYSLIPCGIFWIIWLSVKSVTWGANGTVRTIADGRRQRMR